MTRALVLGGGGVAGIAWTTGVVAGLYAEGVDVRDADVLIGTSAGSTVGAQLTSGTPVEDLYARQLDEHHGEISVEVDTTELIAMMTDLGDDVEPYSAAHRARVGAFALAAKTVPEQRRRAVIEWRLPSHDWPEAPLRIVAVDAESGAERIFDKASGVGLVDAVAASCAVPGIWPPVTIGDRRYVDGGVRSFTNLDLADGYDTVLVIAPIVEPGVTVPNGLLITPDEASQEAIGVNALDPSTRPGAAKAGRAQAAQLVGSVRQLWA
ncbi:patatin-like phospholipase family protein [Labedaea rhizosphaerae]|uniref:patatin-like phospholipase family protein n=1 Tax=Labedaea rhizosphaerae TaxID=598644 RepID=UPI001061BBDC|nr:patatin-like phospholipase family protein [Labedaea rhizosphaerae]